MPGSSASAPSRELLLAAHTFPGEYMIKAFGPNEPSFVSAIQGCAAAVIGAERVSAAQRTTRSGNRVCVSLTLEVAAVDEVEAIYAAIHQVKDLALIF